MRVGIVGLGKFGNYHFNKYKLFEEVESISVCDPYVFVEGLECHSRIEHMVSKVDAVSITSPSVYHYEHAKYFIERGKHCFIEKPICTTIPQAERLVDLANKKGVVLQVGHIERFNSEYLKWRSKIKDLLFFDSFRMCNFTGRSQDIDVVLDLMIHDIDILLTHSDSDITSVYATGAGFCGEDKCDVACVRIIFEDGTYATLTAHRASLVCERKTTFYGKEKTLMVDYDLNEEDSLLSELTEFKDLCLKGGKPTVTGEDGRNALRVALEIKKELAKSGCPDSFQL